MDYKPINKYQEVIPMLKKSIVIELEKIWAYGVRGKFEVRYLFKVTHVPNDPRKKPTKRYYNNGEEPEKYTRYFEKIINEVNKNEKEPIMKLVNEEIKSMFRHKYPQEAIIQANQFINQLKAI